jgi:uncharacterized protein with HEPN domain
VKSTRVYLIHILHCIERIRSDSSGGKETVFSSPTLQDSILRNLQVLCESTQRLPDSLKEQHAEVNWKAMGGLRNILVHDYFSVDLETIWTIVQRDLAELAVAIEQMISVVPEDAE